MGQIWPTAISWRPLLPDTTSERCVVRQIGNNHTCNTHQGASGRLLALRSGQSGGQSPRGQRWLPAVISATSSDEIVTTLDPQNTFSDHDVLTRPCFQSLGGVSPYVELTKNSDWNVKIVKFIWADSVTAIIISTHLLSCTEVTANT